jgi:hypothetical protein
MMQLNQGKLAQHLVNELLDVIHKYDDTLYLATVLGSLEIVKQQLFQDQLEDEEDEY